MRVGDALEAVTLSRVVREITLHQPEEDKPCGHLRNSAPWTATASAKAPRQKHA